MNEAILLLSEPLAALTATQVVGLIILLLGLDNDGEIAARSGTYFDYNQHMLKHLIISNYDQKIGLFVITLPTILQTTSNVPFWSSYLCLIIGLVLRFSPIRNWRVEQRTLRIKKLINNTEETL